MGLELGMNSPPQSQTTILFLLFAFFGQRLVYSVHSTYLSAGFCFFFCLVLLHGWISFVLPAENLLCMVESSQNGSECCPFFVWMSTCNVYVMCCVRCDPVSRTVSAGPMAHHLSCAERWSTSVWNWNCSMLFHLNSRLRMSADTFCISRKIATYLEHFSSQRV